MSSQPDHTAVDQALAGYEQGVTAALAQAQQALADETAKEQADQGTITSLQAQVAALQAQLAGQGGGTAPTPTPSPSKLKPGPAGLVTVQSQNLAGVSTWNLSGGYVLKAPWSTLEPSPGKYDFTLITNTLKTYGTKRMTLRVMAGSAVPADLLTSKYAISNDARGNGTTVGPMWTVAFMDRWQALHVALGKVFDAETRIALVSACAQMTVYAEPFIIGSKPSGQLLYNAGYTPTVQAAAITRCVADTCAAWPSTRVELAGHSVLDQPSASGLTQQWAPSRALSLAIAQAHPGQVISTDYGIGESDTKAKHTPSGSLTTENNQYAWMSLLPKAGLPIGWQLTVDNFSATNLLQAAQNGYDLGGGYIETAGWTSLTQKAATDLDAALAAQAAA